MMYLIQATVTCNVVGGGKVTSQVPSFVLDSEIQGIVSKQHAADVAFSIVNPTKNPNLEVNANVNDYSNH